MTRKSGSKKKILFPLGLILVAVGYGAWALSQPLLSIPATVIYRPPPKPASTVSLDWPAYGQTAVGVPGYGILDTKGDQKPIPTASLAKVMTAIAVLRQRPLRVGEQGPDIVITQADIDSYRSFIAQDGSVVGISLGEHITEYQALQALLLPSSNNMAVTLAKWAFGSVDAYNKYANSYAKQLGLTSIKITDPSGLDAGTVGSARDLTLLGTLAMLNPVFAEIVAQPNATIPVEGKINNYNFQLGESGTIGIKTGNNDQNKGAYMFASKQSVGGQDITIVGTIMDGPNLTTVLRDSLPLIKSVTLGFSLTTFAKAGQTIGTYTVPGRESIEAVTAADLSFPTWNVNSYQASAALRSLTAATPAGTTVGAVTVRDTASQRTSSVPVKTKTTTQQPDIIWRLTHPLGN